MKKLIILSLMSCVCAAASAQFTYKIKADSVKITNDSCNAELILENSTKNIKGFLYNYGNGRTRFQKGLIKIGTGDSLYQIGADTLNLSVGGSLNSWRLNGNAGINPSTNFLGTTDNQPLIFKTNNTDAGRILGNGRLLLGTSTDQGSYKLQVDGDSYIKGTATFRNWNNNSHYILNPDYSGFNEFALDGTNQSANPAFVVYTNNPNHYYPSIALKSPFWGKSIIHQYNGLTFNVETDRFYSFEINNSPKVQINSSGELLVDTTDQGNYKLQVKGDTWTNGKLYAMNNTSFGQNIRLGWLDDNSFTGTKGSVYVSGSAYGPPVIKIENFTYGGTGGVIDISSNSGYNYDGSNLGYGSALRFIKTAANGTSNPNFGAVYVDHKVHASNNNEILYSNYTRTRIGGNPGYSYYASAATVPGGTGTPYAFYADSGYSYFREKVGIGVLPTASSSLSFHVAGNTRFDLGSDATGDLFYRNSSGQFTRLPIGSNGQVLTVSSGLPSWVTGGGGGGSFIENQNSAAQTANLWINGVGKFEGGLESWTVSTTNTRLGTRALSSITTGTNNTAVGLSAMDSTTTGIKNSAFGYAALKKVTTGRFNTAVGDLALAALTASDDNTAIGQASMYNGTTGFGNTAIGSNSLQFIGGDENTAIGKGAMGGVTSGSYNTALGRSAGRDITGNSNIFIGRYAGYSAGTVSNRLYIDNDGTDAITPLIYGEFDNKYLKINGNLQVTDTATFSTMGSTDSSDRGATTKWVKQRIAGIAAGNSWSLTGNSGTDPSTNFLGTTDANRVVLRTNNTEKATIDTAGNFGINTSSPQYKLDVNGSAKINTLPFAADRDTVLTYDPVTRQIKATLPVIPGVLINVRVFSSGTSYTPTSGTKSILIQLVGGGGGGGGVTGANNSIGAGAGGGSGSSLTKYLTGIGSGPYTYSIGSAGTGGANTGGTGGAGGNTTITISATTYTAPGGSGGAGQTAGTAAAIIAGASGGSVATNGDINGAGQPGINGFRLSGTVGSSGSGGSTVHGGGGSSRTSAGSGNAGSGYGAGGGGALSTGNTAQTGGAGTAGIIIIYEYK